MKKLEIENQQIEPEPEPEMKKKKSKKNQKDWTLGVDSTVFVNFVDVYLENKFCLKIHFAKLLQTFAWKFWNFYELLDSQRNINNDDAIYWKKNEFFIVYEGLEKRIAFEKYSNF